MIHAVLALGLLRLYFASAFLEGIPDLILPAPICPDFEAKQDFDKLLFEGQWYTQGMWRSPPNYRNYECSIYNFKLVDDNFMNLNLREYNLEDKTAHNTSIYLRNVDPTKPAYWESFGEITDETHEDFRILDTDYSGYAVVSSCDVNLYERIPYIWVMSKTPSPEESHIDAAVESASRFGLYETDFVRMDRSKAKCDLKK